MENHKKEEWIKNILNEKVEDIKASETLWNKIRIDIYEKEQNNMMKNKWFNLQKSKKLIITTLCVAVGSVTVIGATLSKGWIGHSTIKYTQLPSIERVQKDVGFAPKYVDELPGGFKFENGAVGTSTLTDEAGKAIVEAKNISFSYVKDNDKRPVFLDTEKIDQKYIEHSDSILVKTENEVDFYYYEKIYKFVPVDYELTEADNKAYKAGELEISYGASEISLEQVQSLSWYEEGIAYSLLSYDYDFEVDELLEMAEAVRGE